jgi:hypothetical protein
MYEVPATAFTVKSVSVTELVLVYVPMVYHVVISAGLVEPNPIFIPTIADVNGVPLAVTTPLATVTVPDVVYAIDMSIFPEVIVPVALKLYLYILALVEPSITYA